MTFVTHCIVAVIMVPGEASSPTLAQDGVDHSAPVTRREPHEDRYHGITVKDPYRWLETDVRESPDVRAWVDSQNAYTQQFLDSISQREQIKQRLTQLWNYARYSAPAVVGGKYFFRRNDGLQNQAVLYVADQIDGTPRQLIDPNTWSEDGTIALDSAVPDERVRYLAYMISEAGSDWKKLRVMDLQTGKDLDDELQWLRWSGVTWNEAGDGFYYTRYPEPDTGQQYQALALNQMVYFHRLGTPQAEDRLIYRRADQPEWTFQLERTDDDQFLVLQISKSTDDQNQVYYRPVHADSEEWIELVGDFENQFWFVGSQGRTFYFLTDLEAPTKRVVAMDLDQPGRSALRDVIPAAPETLLKVNVLHQQLVASYLKDATTRVRRFSWTGQPIGEVQFPGLGTARGFQGKPEDTQTFYTFSSFATPPTIYHYDLTTGKSQVWRAAEVDFEAEQFQVEQVFYPSRDGTRVPMFLAYRKGLSRDGNCPTLLYGYGGFNISITPSFRVTNAAWMEMGGILAVPNLRGGGEYGEAWHQAGKTLNKQNVFDDFLSAAQWLIDQEYTCPQRLAIQGGSNGGLLVGAAMTQHPERFGACLPAVGVMDMLRYHLFTAGRFWVDEYGSVDDPAQFRALLAYSPYHNIRPNVAYPATLVTTADTDDRVVPMHSFKFAAALQAAQAGDAPILIRIETRAGHGAGTPTTKQIENAADQLAFLVKTLRIELSLE